jgi:hypothetical protein
MRRIHIAILACLVSTAGCARSGGAASRRASVPVADSLLLASTADSLEGLPARFEQESAAGHAPDAQQMRRDAWATATGRVAEVAARVPESAEREWLIGDVYYAVQHVDVHDAFDLAERHLTRALQLDSTFLPARMSLAQLYVNSDLGHAPAAERLLRGAVVRPGSSEEVLLHEGLAFATYYQGRRQDAAREAARALALGSANPAMPMMASAGGQGEPMPGVPAGGH